MDDLRSVWARSRGAGRALALVAALGIVAGPAAGATGIDPDAEAALRSMTRYLGELPAFSVNADIDLDYLDTAGQKLKLSSSGSILLARPASYYARRSGPFGSYELFIDGKTSTLYSPQRGAYFQVATPGAIDVAIGALRIETGLDLSGADLLYVDAYPGLVTDVTSGAHYGTAWVDGIECHHLAFRAAKVDWQIWIQTGEKPLPMKYVITTKWMTGAPEYSVRFSDWNTQPEIPAGSFGFVPAAGIQRLESLQVNEMGEVEVRGAQP